MVSLAKIKCKEVAFLPEALGKNVFSTFQLLEAALVLGSRPLSPSSSLPLPLTLSLLQPIRTLVMALGPPG